MSGSFTLLLSADLYAVVRLPASEPIPAWAGSGSFSSITRTPDELSIVCVESAVPAGARTVGGMRLLGVQGPLDFALTGVIASLAGPLAAAGVSVFVVATFDTDYLLIRDSDAARAVAALRAAGHRV